jgi:acetylornithine deacetylase/succinyl-diaminopimelate desuccinylase-like protein
VERIAGNGRHEVGSENNDAVREYLLRTLEGFGPRPAVQDAVAKDTDDEDLVVMGRVRNVVATLPGTAPTGRLFLVAHYDSVKAGPGASDDGAGVSSLLEVARALTA